MITNSSITIYHKGFNNETKLETWTRYNYDNAWFFGSKGATINKGYDNADIMNVRISYKKNENLDINNFSVGDILVKGNVNIDIDTQDDLSNYEVFNITNIKNNNFGINKHIHLGGK